MKIIFNRIQLIFEVKNLSWKPEFAIFDELLNIFVKRYEKIVKSKASKILKQLADFLFLTLRKPETCFAHIIFQKNKKLKKNNFKIL